MACVVHVPGYSGWDEMGAGQVHVMWAVASPDKKFGTSCSMSVLPVLYEMPRP